MRFGMKDFWNKYYGKKGQWGAKEDGIFMKSRLRLLLLLIVLTIIINFLMSLNSLIDNYY